MTVTIDPRCPWVQIHPAPDGPAWRLVKFIYEDATESGGNHNIYVNLLRADGTPANNVTVFHWWPVEDFAKADGWTTFKTDASGNGNIAIWPNGFDPAKESHGPYWACPERNRGGDAVGGMGMPLSRHVNYRLFYQWQDAVTPPPDEPPPADGDTWSQIHAFALTLPDVGVAFTANDGRKYVVLKDARVGVVAVGDDGGMPFVFKEELK